MRFLLFETIARRLAGRDSSRFLRFRPFSVRYSIRLTEFRKWKRPGCFAISHARQDIAFADKGVSRSGIITFTRIGLKNGESIVKLGPPNFKLYAQLGEVKENETYP